MYTRRRQDACAHGSLQVEVAGLSGVSNPQRYIHIVAAEFVELQQQ